MSLLKVKRVFWKELKNFFPKYWLSHMISNGLKNKDTDDNAKTLFTLCVSPSKYPLSINRRPLRLTIIFILSNLLLLTFLESSNSEPFIKCDYEHRYIVLIWKHVFFSAPCSSYIRIWKCPKSSWNLSQTAHLTRPCGLCIHSGVTLYTGHWVPSLQKSTWYLVDTHTYLFIEWKNEWMNEMKKS